MLAEIDSKISKAEMSVERDRGIAESITAKVKLAQERAEDAALTITACEEASKLLARYADERQEQVIRIIQDIASLGLTQVFDEPIELKIEQVVRARRVEMDVRIKTGDLETSILDARGGGVAAVAGFLLRVSVLLLTPDTRKIIILDEVFAHLSEEYVPRMAEFLRELSEKTGLQIILVTHQPEFVETAHKASRIERVDISTSQFVENNA